MRPLLRHVSSVDLQVAEAAAAAVCAASCDVYISGRYLTLLQRSLLVKPKVTSPPLAARQREYRGFLRPFNDTMDGFDNLNASEKAEATELQRMIAIEQQKAQFQAQVCMLTMLICNQSVSIPLRSMDHMQGNEPPSAGETKLPWNILQFKLFLTV